MPITPTYPGVYIEELPSTVRTITGVSTSITAFIGRALMGPTDKAMTIHGFPDYERIFGGLWKESNLSYAVYHYFLNGGRDAVIVRVHNGAKPVAFEISGSTLQLESSNPGLWGENLKIEINHKINTELKEEVADETLFNLLVDDTKLVPEKAF